MKHLAAIAALVAAVLLAWSGPARATVLYQPADQQITGNSTIGSFTAYSGDRVYIGFTMDWATGSVGNNEFYVLWFDSDPSQNIGVKGNEDGSGTKDFFVRHQSSDGGAYWPQELTIPNNSRVVGLLEKTVSGAGQPYNRYYLWVNPTSPTCPPPVYAVNTAGDTVISSLGKRAANNNDTVYFRDIVVATTYAEALGSWTAPPYVPAAIFSAADFNDLNTGGLRNQMGGSGFSGAWYGSVDPQVQAGDLASALYAKTQAGNARSLIGGTNPRHEYRALPSPINGEIWFSCLLRNNASNGRVGLTFNPPGGNPFDGQGTAFFELRGTSLAYDFGTGTTTLLPNLAPLGQSTLVVGQILLNYSGANDAISLWLNPNVLDGTTLNDVAALVQAGNDFADAIGHLGVFLQTSGSSFDALYLSNRGTSTAFFDVTGVQYFAIPEPSTLALAAAGLLVLRRRRRRAA